MISDSSLLTHTYSPSYPYFIYIANGSRLTITKIGSITIGLLSISFILFILNLSVNLLSIGQLAQDGYVMTFSSSGCSVKGSSTRSQIGAGYKLSGLYFLDILHLPHPSAFVSIAMDSL